MEDAGKPCDARAETGATQPQARERLGPQELEEAGGPPLELQTDVAPPAPWCQASGLQTVRHTPAPPLLPFSLPVCLPPSLLPEHEAPRVQPLPASQPLTSSVPNDNPKDAHARGCLCVPAPAQGFTSMKPFSPAPSRKQVLLLGLAHG